MVISKGSISLRYIYPTDVDQAVVNAARLDKVSDNPTENLIGYMLRHGHTSPFEHVTVSFLVKAPLFVVHQWQRHRMASYQEESLRYTELKELEVYKPDTFKEQKEGNHQGSSDKSVHHDNQEVLDGLFDQAINAAENFYKEATIVAGVSKEQARIVVPACQYKEFIYTTDLHNCLHFLKLRMDEHAQAEIREYANAIYNTLKKYAPLTIKAWDNYIRESIRLSLDEQKLLGEAINNLLNGGYVFDNTILNKREKTEYLNKLQKMAKLAGGEL